MNAFGRTGSTVVPFSAIGNTTLKQEGKGRMSARRRVLKAAVAASNDRHLTMACVVRDISATGARLRAEGSLTVPDTFDLIIEVDGLEASCEVIWRKANEVGVKFISAPRIVAARRVQVVNPLVPSKAPSLRRTPTQPGRP